MHKRAVSSGLDRFQVFSVVPRLGSRGQLVFIAPLLFTTLLRTDLHRPDLRPPSNDSPPVICRHPCILFSPVVRAREYSDVLTVCCFRLAQPPLYLVPFSEDVLLRYPYLRLTNPMTFFTRAVRQHLNYVQLQHRVSSTLPLLTGTFYIHGLGAGRCAAELRHGK